LFWNGHKVSFMRWGGLKDLLCLQLRIVHCVLKNLLSG
jgi:hypothetical protein